MQRLVGWLLGQADGPVDLLKRTIRELEDQVPALNESLALIKAQVSLEEQELSRRRAREAELVQRARDAPREDLARCYAATLDELRADIARVERRLTQAQATFEQARHAKQAFVQSMEERVQAAKAALAARRQIEWTRKVTAAFEGFGARDDGSHLALVRALEAEQARSEAELRAVLDRLGGGTAARPELATVKQELAVLRARLQDTLRRADELERRLARLEAP